MNKENAHEYMPLVQALANGLTIQEDMGKDGWKDFEEINFDMRPEYYRIKPEPRTFTVWQHRITEEIEALSYINYDENVWERITVQEVI